MAAEKVEVMKNDIRLVYENVYNLKELYKFIREWLVEEGYANDGYKTKDNAADQYMEKFYFERNLNGVKEQVIWWRTFKKGIGKSKRITKSLWIDFHQLGIKDVEVVVDGRKTKAQKGEVELYIRPKLEVDIEKDGGKISKRILKWFKKNVYDEEIEQSRIDCYNDALKLEAEIKQFLEMPTEKPFHSTFHPSKGFY
jgi:hypothetical protein